MKTSRVRKRRPKAKSAPAAAQPEKNKSAAPQRELPRFPKNLQASVEKVVEFQWTIAAYNPDLPAIFSTPAMIGLMEVAAAKAITPHLPAGTISVGTRIEVDHLKAVPQGTVVQAHARLIGYEGRFLAFEVEARAKDLVVGRGKVYRAIVTLKGPDGIVRK
ncbi:MAG: hotdog domain-containing protein [Candidatus Acidiferrales bacterium]